MANIQTLFDFDNKVNVMLAVYTKQLGFNVKKTDIKP